MKSATRVVDVGKRQLAGVRSVRQQDENPLLFGVNPEARSRKAEMSETVFRQSVARRRIFRFGELKRH